MARRRTWPVLVGIAATALALSACSGTTGDTGSSVEVTTLTLWDGFTQYDEDSPYGQLIATCEDQTGIIIERTSSADSLQKLLQAAASQSTPNLTVVDNPDIAKTADVGLIASNNEAGLDTDDVMDNVLTAGQFEDGMFGAPIGSNTLALFYNTELFAERGLTPPTTWDELVRTAAALTSGDVKGLGFSAVATEEGTFQFLPFFWGSGARLDDISSPEAVDALTLWADLVDSGAASSANVNANQQDIRDQFLAGKLGMMVNGTWQLSALDEAGSPYAVVPIPAKDGGVAPSPLGGEFVEVVVSDDAHEEAAGTFAECMIQPENLQKWAEGQSYIMPYESAADAQADANPALEPWVDAVGEARGRTAELGVAYPETSKALYTAIQEALTGTKTPEQALDDAAASISE